MKRRCWKISLRRWLLLTALAVGTGRLCAQDEDRLSSIAFVGNHTFSDRVLAENMITRVPAAWKRWLLGKSGEYSEPLLQQDIRSLIAFYQREGFLDVKIIRQLQRDDRNARVALVLQIEEGRPVQIEQVIHHFAEDSTNRNHLQKVVAEEQGKRQVKSGVRFRDLAIQADQERLTTMLANDGYLYAQVDPKPILFAERYRADLHVWVNQGPLCRFGSASVSGQVKTDSALILKQLAFHRGDLYSQEVLQRSQRFIYQLGVFQFVSIKVRTNASHDHILPVDIAVKEAPRLTTKLGVGYGREEFLRFFVDVRLLNVAGGARRINFYAKHSALEPYNLQLKLTQPAFIHPGASLSLSPFYRSEKEPGFSINRYGTDFSYQQRISYYTDGSISYTFERDGLSVSQITLEEALKNKNIKLYNKSSFTIGLVNDHSYPIFQPQRGWFNAFTTTFTGVGLNSDFHFLRWIFESRKYSKLMEGYVVATRIKIGSMKPLYQDPVTPLEERFYAGGSNSVRGWGRSRLGPLNAENAPIGGNSLLEASVEVRYPIYKLLSGVVFYDMGNVWKEYFTFPVQELRYASGGGLRFQTPIGPIRLDVAWPLGEGKRPLQLHISIGQAF